MAPKNLPPTEERRDLDAFAELSLCDRRIAKALDPAQDSAEPPFHYEEFLEEPQKCYELQTLWNALCQMGGTVDEEATERQKLC
jgi:hypothetical protein